MLFFAYKIKCKYAWLNGAQTFILLLSAGIMKGFPLSAFSPVLAQGKCCTADISV